jgi:hypothetical protein
MQQQQQQFSEFDLLAAFSDEAKAAAAETKLHKEGFSEEEVFRLASDVIANGQFREHGPNRDRSSVFFRRRVQGQTLSPSSCWRLSADWYWVD